MAFITKNEIRDVMVAMKNLAMNMKQPAIPSTKPNLAAFLRMRMKELIADEQ